MIGKFKRNMLGDLLKEGGACFIVSNKEQLRNGDVFYPYRQDSNMLLLTEIPSPGVHIFCYKKDGELLTLVFSDPLTPHEKLWGTNRLTHEEIYEISSIENIFPHEVFDEKINEIVPFITEIFCRQDDYEQYLSVFFSPSQIHPLSEVITPLRMKKTEEEIQCIEKAITITNEAYRAIQASYRSLSYEYEVEAVIAGIFRKYHTTEAYPSIVASGKNATILHYTRHDARLSQDELLLVDFGAEYHGYAADITRVFGQVISKRQEQVLEGVVKVKEYANSLLLPGIRKGEYEKLVREYMNEILESLGLLRRGSQDGDLLSRKYFPHSVSHYLGLDVHDTGEKDMILEAGMVLTCEPGIYISEEGIGVRLEDDILLTEQGNRNLSKEIPLI